MDIFKEAFIKFAWDLVHSDGESIVFPNIGHPTTKCVECCFVDKQCHNVGQVGCYCGWSLNQNIE